MSPESPADRKFLADRMLGTLTRYLRFMGYDTVSANDLLTGNRKEDTELLARAEKEHRLLLTRDAELARRGNTSAVLVHSEDVIDQIQQLIDMRLVSRRITLSRCSLCNTPLRQATSSEIGQAEYAPRDRRIRSFFWCSRCRKLYWNGSHGRRLEERVDRELRE